MTLEMNGGIATIVVSRATWLKLIALLIGLLVGYAKMQGAKIDSLCTGIAAVKAQVESTDHAFDEFKKDYRASMKRMDDRITSLDEYLRKQSAAAQ